MYVRTRRCTYCSTSTSTYRVRKYVRTYVCIKEKCQRCRDQATIQATRPAAQTIQLHFGSGVPSHRLGGRLPTAFSGAACPPTAWAAGYHASWGAVYPPGYIRTCVLRTYCRRASEPLLCVKTRMEKMTQRLYVRPYAVVYVPWYSTSAVLVLY